MVEGAATKSGGGGIRTHGPVLPGQHVSTVPLSAAQPLLRRLDYKRSPWVGKA